MDIAAMAGQAAVLLPRKPPRQPKRTSVNLIMSIVIGVLVLLLIAGAIIYARLPQGN
jgi:hypothetical protein